MHTKGFSAVFQYFQQLNELWQLANSHVLSRSDNIVYKVRISSINIIISFIDKNNQKKNKMNKKYKEKKRQMSRRTVTS